MTTVSTELKLKSVMGHGPTGESKQSRSAEIDKFVRGSILRGRSSIELQWKGFTIERHHLPAGERPEKYSDHHFIILWDIPTCNGERADKGRFVPYVRRPGAISLFTSGVICAVRNFNEMEVTVGALSPSLISGIVEELDQRPNGSLHEKINFQEDGLRTLMSLLVAESEAGGPCGRLYGESLYHALASRFVQLGTETRPQHTSKFGLPGRLLRRVVERMKSEFATNLSLAALAAETGYSRAHFLRMFRTATGQTPHQYLLAQRLENAAQMMKDRSIPLVDIAVACGFSSHTHFTKVFRTRFGILPSQYRRNANN